MTPGADADARLAWGVGGIAVAVFVVLLAGASGYGPHRDELYFLAAGDHLAWGYPDQGPLTPAVAAAMDAIGGGSLTALRLPSAFAIAAVVVLTGLLARELGGRARAQLIAAATVAVGAVFLITGHLLSTSTFDLLAWTAITLVVVRAVRREDDRLWLMAGLILGLGLLNKPLLAFLAVALLAAVAICGPRRLLRSPWVWAGAAIAVAIWSPWLIWQAREGWPQLEVAAELSDGGSASSEPRWALLPFQLLLISPLLAPVWLAGLWELLRGRDLADLRFLGWTWVILAALFLITGGKPYYLAGMFPLLIAAGAPAVDRWLDRGRRQLRAGALAAALAVSAAISLTLALPILPEEALDPVVAMNEAIGETVGWPEFTATVAEVHARVPDGVPAVILTSNYGEAGAIDRYGPEFGLPGAYSGHNGYWHWGPPPDGTAALIAIGFGARELTRLAGGCEVAAHFTNPAEVENEELGRAVWLCEPAPIAWSKAWPGLEALG